MKNNIITTILIVGLISTFTFANEKTTKKKKTTNTSEVRNVVEVPQSSRLNRHSIGVGLGETFLFGGFDDLGEDRLSADFLYSYSASYSFDLLTNIHYSSHKFKGQEVSLTGISASIKGKAFQFDKFSPFAIGGLGFYRPTIKRVIDGRTIESDKKWTFGTNFGGGVDLQLNSDVTFGVLIQYHNPFDIKQEDGPQIEGSYSKIMITSMYTF